MSRGQNESCSSRTRALWWLVGVAAVLALGAGILAIRLPERPRADAGGPTVSGGGTGSAGVRRETRPTLDPARFVGKPARAHQVAREMPDVLDRLYCYCECDRYLGHRSLLSCYTDGHAAT